MRLLNGSCAGGLAGGSAQLPTEQAMDEMAKASRFSFPTASGRLLMIHALWLAAWAFVSPAAASGQEPLAIGERPPAAALETLDGEPFQLQDVLGDRPVLVEFWATWCPVCRALEPEMEAAYERFGDQVEFLVVAVGVGQNPGSIRAHLQRHPQPGQVLWDARGAAVRAFSAPGTGIIFILDENGEVAYQGAGADQDLSAALAEVLAR